MTTDKQDRVDAFLSSLQRYVTAAISNQTTEQDMDSMGTWHEEKDLRYNLELLMGMEPRSEDV